MEIQGSSVPDISFGTADVKSSANVAAIILSGGAGTRAGGNIPKQYIEAGGRPLLSYSMESFEHSRVDGIVVVAAGPYIDYVRKLAADYGITKVCGVAVGGSERYESVLNGLRALKKLKKTWDYVLIHDGARPFISSDGVNLMIEAVSESGAAVAGMPVRDTIKITDDDGLVTMTTDRAHTWQVQTPQCFRFDEICEAYERVVGRACSNDMDGRDICPETTLAEDAGSGLRQPAPEYDISRITDDAMVYSLAFPGMRVKMVDIKEENGKVTAPEDLVYADWKLGHRQSKTGQDRGRFSVS